MASRYEVLTRFLDERSEAVVETTFAELDRLVGGLAWRRERSSPPLSGSSGS